MDGERPSVENFLHAEVWNDQREKWLDLDWHYLAVLLGSLRLFSFAPPLLLQLQALYET